MKNKKVLKIGGALLLLISLLSVVLFIGTKETNKNSTLPPQNNIDYSPAKLVIGNYVSTSSSFSITFESSSVAIGKELIADIKSRDKNYKISWYRDNKLIENETKNTLLLSEKDLESTIKITVKTTDDEASATAYISKLPVVYINTEDNKAITSKDVYTNAYMKTQSNLDLFDKKDFLYQGSVEISGRGNSTWNRPKKPYKIKLETKSDLFGMGLSKHWVLLANDIDHTQLRNSLVEDFASSIGMKYSTESAPVVLIINGIYEGVYTLSEQVRIEEERVNILSYEELAESAAKEIIETQGIYSALKKDEKIEKALDLEEKMQRDFSWLTSPYNFTYENKSYNISEYVEIPKDLTGGFLLEMDFYSLGEKMPSQMTTAFNQPIYFSRPEYGGTNKILYNYAQKYIQSFEYSLHSDTFTFNNNDTHYKAKPGFFDWDLGWVYEESENKYEDTLNDGKHYSDFFDIDSLVEYFIVTEFAMNWDSMKNSVFMYKDIDGLAYMGPVWDYDWSFGNKNMFGIMTDIPNEWHTTNEYFTNEQFYQSVQWYRYLIKDPYFLKLVYDKYQEIRPTVIEDIIKEGGVLDTHITYMKEAAAKNDARWGNTYNKYDGEYFMDAMNSLESFINTRVSWLDEQFVDFETFKNSLGYYKKSDLIKVELISKDEATTTFRIVSNDSLIKNAILQINGTFSKEVSLLSNSTTVSINNSDFNNLSNNVVCVFAKDSNKDSLYIENDKASTIRSYIKEVTSDGGWWGKQTAKATFLNPIISNYLIY